RKNLPRCLGNCAAHLWSGRPNNPVVIRRRKRPPTLRTMHSSVYYTVHTVGKASEQEAGGDVWEPATTVRILPLPIPEQAASCRPTARGPCARSTHRRRHSRGVCCLRRAARLLAGANDVEHQALRAARSVWKRAGELRVVPVLCRPLCQRTHQNRRLE